MRLDLKIEKLTNLNIVSSILLQNNPLHMIYEVQPRQSRDQKTHFMGIYAHKISQSNLRFRTRVCRELWRPTADT